MADEEAALNLARKKRQKKKRTHNEARVSNLNAKNRKVEEHEDGETFRHIVDFNNLVW